VADVAVVAERLVGALAQMGRENPHEGVLDITCSVGVAMLGPDSSTVSALHEQADTAMYEAKTAGGNRFALSADDLASAPTDPSS
jgi:diguanylate cyclase (GGDEF)-like protein